MLRKRFKWTNSHDKQLQQEVLNSDTWMTRTGSAERGGKWKKIADTLKLIDVPKFKTTRVPPKRDSKFCWRKEK